MRKTSEREIRDLIAELHVQYGKVREKAAWLELKQSELRPDDQVSLVAMMEAKQECRVEQSLLAGHAFMVQQIVHEKRITLDRDSQHLLQEIRAQSYRLSVL